MPDETIFAFSFLVFTVDIPTISLVGKSGGIYHPFFLVDAAERCE